MDAQPNKGGFGCFKGVLQVPFFFLCNFTSHKAIFYFNPKMGHMLDLAIVVANSALPLESKRSRIKKSKD